MPAARKMVVEFVLDRDKPIMTTTTIENKLECGVHSLPKWVQEMLAERVITSSRMAGVRLWTGVGAFLFASWFAPVVLAQDSLQFQLSAKIDELAGRLDENTEKRPPDAVLSFVFNRPYPLQYQAFLGSEGGCKIRIEPSRSPDLPPSSWVCWIPAQLLPSWPVGPQTIGVDQWLWSLYKPSKLRPDWFVTWPGGRGNDLIYSPRAWLQEVFVGGKVFKKYQYKVWLDYSKLPSELQPKKEQEQPIPDKIPDRESF